MGSLLIGFIVISSSFLLIEGTSPSCMVGPHHHTAYGQWANRANATHRLSLLIPSLHHGGFRKISDEELLGEDTPLAGSTDCPSTPLYSMDEPLMGRSLCPWYWKINYNALRIPAVLPEAVCRCRHAVMGTTPYECQPITMRLRVLEMDEKCENYYERTIDIATACVSVNQASVRLNKMEGVQRIFHPQRLESMIDVK